MVRVLEKPRAEPSGLGAADPMMKHLIERDRNSDGSWGEWKDKTLCGKLWDRPFLAGSLTCGECEAVLRRRLGR